MKFKYTFSPVQLQMIVEALKIKATEFTALSDAMISSAQMQNEAAVELQKAAKEAEEEATEVDTMATVENAEEEHTESN